MARRLPVLLSLLLFCGAVVLCLLLSLGYDHWLAVANQASAKGNAADYLTPETWAGLVRKGVAVAAVMSVLAAVLMWKRTPVSAFFTRVADDAAAVKRDTANWLRHLHQEDGWPTWIALLIIFAAGAAIRLRDLSQPLRHDEALVFLNFVRRPLYLIVSLYNDVANHVFETVLKHGSWLLFGDAEWAIRLPVFLAGCLIPVVLFFSLRAPYGRTTALLTAAMAAGCSFLIEYSVNARGYEVLTLWIAVLMGLRSSLAKRDNVALWLTWAVFSALAFWTHPAAILSYGVVALWLFLGILCRRDGTLKTGFSWLVVMSLLGAVLTILLYAPILITMGAGHMSHMAARGQGDLRLTDPVLQFWQLLSLFIRNFTDNGTPFLVAFAAVGLSLDHWRNGKTAPLALAMALWCGLYLTLFPVFGFARLWLPFTLFVFLLASIGLSALFEMCFRHRLGNWGVSCCAVFITLFGVQSEWRHDFVRLNNDGTFFESREVAADFAQRLTGDDVVYGPCPATMPLQYGFLRLGIPSKVMTADAERDLSGAALQLLTLDRGTEAWKKGDGHPSGSLYLIMTETQPSLSETISVLGYAAPVQPELISDYPHTKVYRLPMPPRLMLH